MYCPCFFNLDGVVLQNFVDELGVHARRWRHGVHQTPSWAMHLQWVSVAVCLVRSGLAAGLSHREEQQHCYTARTRPPRQPLLKCLRCLPGFVVCPVRQTPEQAWVPVHIRRWPYPGFQPGHVLKFWEHRAHWGRWSKCCFKRGPPLPLGRGGLGSVYSLGCVHFNPRCISACLPFPHL